MLNERQLVAAEASLARRLRCLVWVEDDVFIDLDYITNLEYQLFLDEMRLEGRCLQPDHWLGYSFKKGLAHYPVVGIRPSDADKFCRWLTLRVSQGSIGSWEFRLPRASELTSNKVETDLVARGTVRGYWAVNGNTFVFEEDRAVTDVVGLSDTLPIKSLNSIASLFPLIRGVQSERADDLESALAIAQSRSQALLRSDVLNRTRKLFFDRARTRVRSRVSSLLIELDRTLGSGLKSVIDVDRLLSLKLADDTSLSQALQKAFERSNTPNRSRHLAVALDLALDLAIDLALALSAALDNSTTTATRRIVVPRDHNAELALDYLAETVSACLDLISLEARIKGVLQAIEGIRIVKSRLTD